MPSFDASAFARTISWRRLGAATLSLVAVSGCGGGSSPAESPTPTPSPQTYAVGGTVSGLTGTVVLENNGGDALTIAMNGPFAFSAALASGSAYSVTVSTQPAGQTCAVASGSSTVSTSNVTSVAVSCTTNSYTIGGKITGLTQTGLVLSNGSDQVSPGGNDASFVFPTAVPYKGAYSVAVATQPPGQTCTVAGGAGTVGSGNITSVVVNCAPLGACLIASGRPVFGANVISVGNAYDAAEYSDANLDAFFTALASQGIREVSLRVIWQIMEPTARGSYDADAIAQLNRILSKTDENGFAVMLTFHTSFNASDQWWQAPAWLAAIAPPVTVNGETIPAGSLRQLFYVSAVSDAYLEMMQYVVNQVGSHGSLKYIALLNEPYLSSGPGASNEPYFAATMQKLLSGVRSVTKVPLGIRFLPDWNPWSDVAAQQLGTDMWQDFDYIGMNLYLPEDQTVAQGGTVIWPMAQRALAAIHAAQKPMFVTEINWMDESTFNAATGTDAQYGSYWQYIISQFAAFQPDLIQIWDAENDGDFFSPATGGFNILKAQATPADYVTSTIRPYLCQ